jgi:hypothetical protein
MTQTNAFDEAAVRAWLEGPDPAVGVDTVAEALGIDNDFNLESDDWLSVIEDLVQKAGDAKLLPEGTLVWLTCSSEGDIDGALVTRAYDKVRLCSSFLGFQDLLDDSRTTGIDCAVSVLSAIHLLAADLHLPGESKSDVDPAAFADTDSLCAVIEVDVFRDGDETLSVRDWAERGWEAVRDLTAPVIALRNQAGVQIEVDLEDDVEEE